MSSDEENYYDNVEEEVGEVEEKRGEVDDETEAVERDLSSSPIDVNLEINCDGEIDENEPQPVTSPSYEQGGKIALEELPHSGNTKGFKERFESTTEDIENRAARRRERRRQRRLTEEEDGPAEGSAKLTLTKFEKGEIDDTHFVKTDITPDEVASTGTVSLTTEKFTIGNIHISSSDGNEEEQKVDVIDDKDVVESGTAATRRKALERYAEEATKEKPSPQKLPEEDEAVVSPGIAASTRAKLERMASQERFTLAEKHVDVNVPKQGTASERRARFEEKARQSSVEEVPKPARRSKWPEPKTKYHERTPEPRRDPDDSPKEQVARAEDELSPAGTPDDEAIMTVEKENAKNLELNADEVEESGTKSPGVETPSPEAETGTKSPEGVSTDEESHKPVRTADIRNKFVKMFSEDQQTPTTHKVDRIGNARPSSGMARNLRAKFETGEVFHHIVQEESHISSTVPSSKSGYASRVKERFESGEVARHRASSTNTDEGDAEDTKERRHRTSSQRVVEDETTAVMRRSAKELRNRFENPSQTTKQAVKRNFVVRTTSGGAANIASKFTNPVISSPSSQKCTTCSKTVYPVELITADNKPYHKMCFKCAECKSTVRLGNFAALQGKIYCKPHFKQLFQVKGNYDEGFGRQQHKKNWEVGKPRSQSMENELKNNEKNYEDDSKLNGVDNSPQDNSPQDNDTHALSNGYDDVTSNGPTDGQTNGHVELDDDDHLYDEVEA